LLAVSLANIPSLHAQTIQGYMPDESETHEGTWLQWPHSFTYGTTYRDRLTPTWIAMTRALVAHERVHIIVCNGSEKSRVQGLLTTAGISLSKVDFLIRRTDDVWVRDNGPVFVYDNLDRLKITDWGFNGWGFDAPYSFDNSVPEAVASSLGVPRVNLNSTVLEGGSIEVDGYGMLMATRSSILEPFRNNLTQAQIEASLRAQLGVTKFIWLDGADGGQDDITDTHIDGFARFGPNGTIVTMSAANLAYWGISPADINTLYSAKNLRNAPYSFVQLPLTANNVVTTYGFNLGYKGSYVNYYVANNVVLVPTYNDPNDTVAKNLLKQIYPDRQIIGIDCRNLYREGGMIHCVTQQQPVTLW
jgi:agmatine deiminase